MLCDSTIRKHLKRGDIVIHPEPEDVAFQPASVDLRLNQGHQILLTDGYHEFDQPVIFLHPDQCVLASTLEEVKVPAFMVARVEGKSTWGRRFLQVHSTAGFIDPGFHGRITLELRNNGPRVLRLIPGDYIAQLSFDFLDKNCDRPYGHKELNSHYQGQQYATLPKQ